MFTTLLESGTKVTRQDRWLTTSTGVHMLMLASAVALTPQRTIEIDEPFPRDTLVWVDLPPEPKHTSSTSSSGPASASGMPSIRDVPRPAGGPSIDVFIPDVSTGQSSGDVTSGSFPSESPSSSISGSTPGSGPMSAGAVDKPALPLPGNARPVYPEMLRSAGIAGSVLMRFVIDTTGRVEPQSLQVVRADQEMFATSVRTALKQHRFLPAEAAGRKVRMLVEQRFDFALNAH